MLNYFIALLTVLNLILIIIFFRLNYTEIKKQFSLISKPVWIMLFLILLFGTSLRVLSPQHHMMFVDEYWTMDAAKNMFERGPADICEYIDYERVFCSPYPKTTGTPLRFSISFLFGVNNYHAIYTNIILGSLSIIIMFALSYLLLNREDIAIYSSLLFATYPLYILWSSSASTNMPGLFFFLLTLTTFLLYLKTRTYKAYTLSILSLAYLIHVRIEFVYMITILIIVYIFYDERLRDRLMNPRIWNLKIVLILIIIMFFTQTVLIQISAFLIIFLIFDKKIQKKIMDPKLWRIWSVFALFLVSIFFQAISYIPYINQIQQADISVISVQKITTFFQIIFTGTLEYFSGIINGLYFPYYLILLSFIGIFYLKKHKNTLIIPTTTFFIFSYFFITFGLEKVLLFAYVGVLFVTACGVFHIKEYLMPRLGKTLTYIIIIILLLATFFPYISPYYSTPITDKYTIEAKSLETRILHEIDIPDNCYIIAKYPSVLATTNLKVVSIDRIINNESIFNNIFSETGCLMFYEDLGCFIEMSPSDNECVYFFNNIHFGHCLKETPTHDCVSIKSLYNAEVFSEHTLGNFTYTFYKLSPNLKTNI